MNETVLLRNQIAALTKERDEWMRSLEFSLKQRDKLTAERDALKDAARLALDAMLLTEYAIGTRATTQDLIIFERGVVALKAVI